MSQLVQAHAYVYNDSDSGLIDTTYCPDNVVGDECQSEACWFDFAFSGQNTTYTSTYLAFTYQLNNICPGETDFRLFYDGYGTVGNIFEVYFDDVLEWQSPCTTASSSQDFTVPAGTRKVRFVVFGSCSSYGDVWSIQGVCL